jgi:hypothetical protein
VHKLLWLHDEKDLFQLSEEQDLLWAVHLGPEPQQSCKDGIDEGRDMGSMRKTKTR